ncbi:hypothetical protein K458DRAFT_424211 [Lentithecium fluviatile CBS 122367]|uniref:Uncharacterized protein n=1 Tax=Lentithecium fluviatile CBS 122367 TaxID=1168545 RepID=A0A6G1IG57_9PLEO|nr:hypothetical protein K458DRAFT_424211 [Lentithecium fluviatile CBS 122367]
MCRTLRPGGTTITSFWLSIPQGESAGETRRRIWGPDAKPAIEPYPRHKDLTFNTELMAQGGFYPADVQPYKKSATLPVKDLGKFADLDEFACAIWSTIGEPLGGCTQEDEERWDAAVAMYKKVLSEKEGSHVDGEGNVELEAVAQIEIVKKRA